MTEFLPLFQSIKNHLKGAERVLIIAHQKPDGDALGAALALSHYLDYLKIPHVCFCKDQVPQQFFFMPSVGRFTHDHEAARRDSFDVICVVDSGDLVYAGAEELVNTHSARNAVILNIDHHPTNTNFGHCNLVHDTASSTSEIIFHFLDHQRYPISQETATCLLTGILTDTGIFSNLATTPSSLEVASRLFAYGARVKDIMRYTMRNMSLVNLQLWGRALSRLKEDAESGIVTTVITRADFDELGITEDGTEGIANFLNNLGQARMVMVLKEFEQGKIKASLRTTHADVDVSKLAQAFGGGGHKKAAGFTIEGALKETETGWEVV